MEIDEFEEDRLVRNRILQLHLRGDGYAKIVRKFKMKGETGVSRAYIRETIKMYNENEIECIPRVYKSPPVSLKRKPPKRLKTPEEKHAKKMRQELRRERKFERAADMIGRALGNPNPGPDLSSTREESSSSTREFSPRRPPPSGEGTSLRLYTVDGRRIKTGKLRRRQRKFARAADMIGRALGNPNPGPAGAYVISTEGDYSSRTDGVISRYKIDRRPRNNN